MNINELYERLTKLNINISAKEICDIWGMDVSSFSRKRKIGSPIKHKNIVQLQQALNIKLIDTPNHFLYSHKDANLTQGERIKKIRKNLNLKLNEFALLIGSNISDLKLIEANKDLLSNTQLCILLNQHNININYIIGGFGPIFNPSSYESVQEDLHQQYLNLVQESNQT